MKDPVRAVLAGNRIEPIEEPAMLTLVDILREITESVEPSTNYVLAIAARLGMPPAEDCPRKDEDMDSVTAILQHIRRVCQFNNLALMMIRDYIGGDM